MLLKYHPDKKAGVAESEVHETNPRFLSIQKAYDTLSDPERRRGYDSQFDFDDSIPSGNETADFFEVGGAGGQGGGRLRLHLEGHEEAGLCSGPAVGTFETAPCWAALCCGKWVRAQVYGPVFVRNSRFSVRKPVPRLGDSSTPITEVYQFYQWWWVPCRP